VDFTSSDEQQQLAQSIARFFAREYDFAARRAIVASDEGWSRAIWTRIAELGLLALPLPEDCGGFGGRAIDLVAFMQGAGRALLVEPYLGTIGLCARLLARSGSALRSGVLPTVAAGELVLAFAHAERDARYDLAHVGTRALQVAGGYQIDGEKHVVLGASCADRLVVSARVDGDSQAIGLFVVDPKLPGVAVRPYRTIDGQRAADVRFERVRVAGSARVDADGNALALIEDAVDYATALVCAEAVGALGYANDATLDYVKTRRQFGVPIGSFQALQHRLVDMHIAAEQAASMSLLACTAVDEETNSARRMRAVSAAKIRVAEACRHVSQEAIQLHGGMGMSDEVKVSHTFRRLTVIGQQFGDVDHHLARFAMCAE
jgi:alkylation response protein AidB-like acyl-CoA dehydrogenase